MIDDTLPEFPPSYLINAYMEGRKACANGFSYAENPYPKCPLSYNEWSKGWIDMDSYSMREWWLGGDE